MSVRMEGPESKMYSPPEKRSGNDRNDPNVDSTFSTNELQVYSIYIHVLLGCIPKLKSLHLQILIQIDFLFKNLRAQTKAPHLLAPFE